MSPTAVPQPRPSATVITPPPPDPPSPNAHRQTITPINQPNTPTPHVQPATQTQPTLHSTQQNITQTGQPSGPPNNSGNSHPVQGNRLSSQPTLFDVPDFELARRADKSTYRQHVQKLHMEMCGGDVTEYVETKIPLPRSLQGLKTGQVMTKLFSLNPSLNTDDYDTVMADVVGPTLVVGTVSEKGRKMIDTLLEVKVEPGRTVSVPTASKPNNLYFVELLLPYERELHLELLEAFLLKFPTARYTSMPGKKAWGTTHRTRLYFNSTTAPREVFTPTDENIPIREVTLSCGTAAQVIHKWQRLNQTRPPHLSNRWQPSTLNRSYAAVANNTNQAATQKELTLPQQRNTTPRQPDTQGRRTLTNARQNNLAEANENEMDISPDSEDVAHIVETARTAQLVAAPDQPQKNTTPQNGSIPNMGTSDNPHTHSQHTNLTPNRANSREQDATQKDRVTQNSDPLIRPIHDTNTNKNFTTSEKNQPTAATIMALRANSHLAATAQRTRTQSAPPDASHENTPADPSQWKQVKRPRKRRTPSESPAPAMTIQASSSRTKKQPSNKFATLDFKVHPSYEDDMTPPITVSLPPQLRLASRRRHKTTRKAWTKQVTDAANSTQEIRHPNQIMQHLSPHQSQVLLRSKLPEAKDNRVKLLRQIALLRTARTHTTSQNIRLEMTDDNTFLEQVTKRISECHEPMICSSDTPIDLALSAMHNQDELQVRRTMCFSWIDLATRALFPAIYDSWPKDVPWHNISLAWLPADDREVPCLQDEALAALAACPTLQNIWTHVGNDSEDLERAIRTATNQWRRFINSESLRTASAHHGSHQ